MLIKPINLFLSLFLSVPFTNHNTCVNINYIIHNVIYFKLFVQSCSKDENYTNQNNDNDKAHLIFSSDNNKYHKYGSNECISACPIEEYKYE